MLVTGEASGDEHGAELVHHLRKLHPNVRVFGMGGSKLRAAGMETTVDAEAAAAVMGITEIFGSLGKLLAALRALKRAARQERPDVVVLIDFPDFNLLLARRLKRLKIPVLYFITPQLWAWRQGRVKSIRKYVRKVAPIFPFEESFFQRHGVDAEYVGHPFLSRSAVSVSREELFAASSLDPRRPLLSLLPGSRKAEVEFLLPAMLDAFERLQRVRPDLQAAVPVAPTLDREWVSSLVGARPGVVLVDGKARELLQFARAAVVASGTATVEAALVGLPFVVVYRLAPLTYRIARFLVRGVKNFAMPNLIAGKKVVPELLQSEVTGEKIALELERVLGDPAREARMRSDLRVVGQRLEAGLEGRSPAERTAEIVLELAEEKLGRPTTRFQREPIARGQSR